MMKKRSLAILSAAVLAAVTGCSNIQYVGRKFDALPEGAPILFTWDKTEIDPAKYMIIGHGILTTPGDYDRYQVEEQLTKAASERGADAVCVTASRRVNEGVYDLDEDELTFPQDDNSLEKLEKPEKTTQTPEDKTWGKPVTLQGEYHGRDLLKVRAVFWKERTIAEPLIRQQEELLKSKASGNWNGENDVNAPKKAPSPELLPLPPPVSHPLPAAPVEQTPTAEETAPAILNQENSFFQGPNSPERPQFAVPPVNVVPMP